MEAAEPGRIEALELQLADTRKQMEQMMQSMQQSMMQSMQDAMKDAFSSQLRQVQQLLNQNITNGGEVPQDRTGTNDPVPPVATAPGVSPANPIPVHHGREGADHSPHSQSRGPAIPQTVKVPKFEFPRFNGEHPRNWIRKCQKYFHLNPMNEGDMVLTAAMHMEGQADSWYLDYLEKQPRVTWDKFCDLVIARFTDVFGGSVVGEFKKLKQDKSVHEYVLQFEELKGLIGDKHQFLTEDYYIDNFVTGLKEEIGQMVAMLKPQTLSDAMFLARGQEKVVNSMNKGPRQWNQRGPVMNSNEKTWRAKPYEPSSSKELSTNPPPLKRLTPEEMLVRRRKNLCYNCDETYTPGHKCKRLFVICGREEEGEGEEEELDLDRDLQEDEELKVSLNAVAGQSTPDYLRVLGTVGKHHITILIDCGSTHTFLNPNTAQALNCDIEITEPLTVVVADGNKIQCNSKCSNFKWQMGGCTFVTGVRLLHLGGCDMVMGVDFLKKLGGMYLNFEVSILRFIRQGQVITLRGIDAPLCLQSVKGKKIQKLIDQESELLMGMVCMLTTVSETQNQEAEKEEVNPDISHLLQQYDQVFAEPTSLPPHRGYDHAITLKPGVEPVKQNPYRYPYLQRMEIERLVSEMLKAGIIQPSNSPWSSPVLLVKKKDGTWRFCIDYRKLNSLTIKNSFPIPLVGELLDELRAAKVFSKIDLRAGYHQVRVSPKDISKTAFVTVSGLYEFKVMPFGLTNAPATFQALMNSVFQPYLRKFVLVFFDDILVYSPSIQSHLVHLTQVFQLLTQNQLFAKRSKCAFGKLFIEYLGHIIGDGTVAADPHKIQAMVDWPVPKSVKALRGFLGLTGYYRSFVRQYGVIARPLTELTKKGKFKWGPEADIAFQKLKEAMSSAPVLQLPDFSKVFILETDASYSGLGAVLMQENHPIAYISKALGPRSLGLSVYEKELLAIILATQKWRAYLIHNQFIIKTDQQSLKYLLEQKISTPLQHKYLTKLLGFDYKIEYKRGVENKAADGLSRQFAEEGSCLAITTIHPAWIEEIVTTYDGDEVVQDIIAELVTCPYNVSHFSYNEGLLRYHGKLYVGSSTAIRNQIIETMHSSPLGGHSGIQGTLQRLRAIFHWPGMKQAVKEFVLACQTCQLCKHENVKTPGLLQPLPIPDQAWMHISMDFIEQLPISEGKDTIWVVVDRFSKYAHFISLHHPFTASSLANNFLDTIYKLHGLPSSIVSDRDRIFTSQFWSQLFKLLGVQQNLSTAYHPQSDGQTERVNQCLESYLRCMCSNSPKQWHRWLPLAEWWYNTNFHTSTKHSPFEILYGYKPSQLALGPYLQTTVQGVEELMTTRQQMQHDLKLILQQAQDRMKAAADRSRSKRDFTVGDWVFLKLKPYKQSTLHSKRLWKLSPKFAGPFQIIQRVGSVAYKLALPDSAQVHPVFHVSQLKRSIGNAERLTPHFPALDDAGKLLLHPVKILDRRIIKRNNAAASQVLIQWAHLPIVEATWEDYDRMTRDFPEFMA